MHYKGKRMVKSLPLGCGAQGHIKEIWSRHVTLYASLPKAGDPGGIKRP